MTLFQPDLAFVSCLTGQSTSGIGASGGNEVVVISPRPGTLDWFKACRIVRNET